MKDIFLKTFQCLNTVKMLIFLQIMTTFISKQNIGTAGIDIILVFGDNYGFIKYEINLYIPVTDYRSRQLRPCIFEAANFVTLFSR